MDKSQPVAVQKRGWASPPAGIVLALLCLTNAINLGDRVIIGPLQEPLRAEFNLSDFQLGLLGGPAFAVLYTLCGLPIARLAERTNRVTLVAAALAAWSAMTALCGAAGSFVLLLLARAGVSVGEAGCAPPAQSLISDLYPAERRARALAVYALGAPLGSMVVTFGAAIIAERYGWRAAFIVFGAVGLVAAAVVALVARDPRTKAEGSEPVPDFKAALRVIFSKRSFVLVSLGAAFAGFCGFFIAQYLVSFLMRSHALGLAQAAGVVALGFGVGGAAGTYMSGAWAQHWGRRNPNALVQAPAIGLALATICYVPALTLTSTPVAIALLLAGAFFQNFYMAQSMAVVQAVAPSRMRATSAALYIAINSIIGFGLGPPLLGALSDAVSQAMLSRAGFAQSACASVSVASQSCADAHAFGLQTALVVASLGFVICAVIYLYAAKTLQKDMVA